MKSKNNDVLGIFANFHQLINLFIGLILLTLTSSVFGLSCSNGCQACNCTVSSEKTMFSGTVGCFTSTDSDSCDPTGTAYPYQNPPKCISCYNYCKDFGPTGGMSMCAK